MPAFPTGSEPELGFPLSAAAQSALWRHFSAFETAGVGRVRLRHAVAADDAFVEALYLETMLPLLRDLGDCDPAAVRSRFGAIYAKEAARIVHVGEADIGWIEIRAGEAQLWLRQLHLVAPMRNRGLGSELVKRVLAAARELELPVSLYVVRNNPARRLYERLGFELVGESGVRLHLRHALAPGPGDTRLGSVGPA